MSGVVNANTTFRKDRTMAWGKTKSWGMMVLAIWLIIQGAIFFVDISFAQLGAVMAILAIAAGVLLLIGR